MSWPTRARLIAGWVLHVLIGGLMLFAGSGKVLGNIPPEVLKSLDERGLGDKMTLIGAGEMISAVLLLIPWTLSLGALTTSAFWGGVILFHMMAGDGYAPGSVLLALTWLGAYLRQPSLFGSFRKAPPFPASMKPVAHSSPSP